MKKIILIAIFMLLPVCSSALKWEIKEINGYNSSTSWKIIECSDSLNIIMVGNEFNGIPRVIKSTDGGDSWTFKLNVPIKDYMNDPSLKFTEAYSAYYKDDFIILFCIERNDRDPYIIRSFNGGEDWETFMIDVYADFRSQIYFDDSFGIIVSKNKIYQSKDYGKTWELLLEHELNGIGWFIDDFRFNSINEFSYTITNNEIKKATICKTSDMGESWEVIDIPYTGRLIYFAFYNDDIGWISCSVPNGIGDRSNAIVYKTIDGGKNWDKVLDAELSDNVVINTFAITDIECINDSSAMIVGSDRLAAMTKNGGKTWELVSEGLENVNQANLFKVVRFIKPNVIIAGGWKSLVGKLELDMLSSVANENNAVPSPLCYLTNSEVQISMNGFNAERIIISDLLGQITYSKSLSEFEKDVSINVNDYPVGAYIVVITGKNNQKTVFKIIKS